MDIDEDKNLILGDENLIPQDENLVIEDGNLVPEDENLVMDYENLRKRFFIRIFSSLLFYAILSLHNWISL
jgi:hypothetical protein